MKQFATYVEGKRIQFQGKPLFQFLRDTTIDPRRRLEFVPRLTHFVMSFADLYRYFLPERPSRDRFQELVNVHVAEDANHWKWFLADLKALDADPTQHFSDALRFIWDESTIKTRMLTYQMCKMSAGMSSLQKLALIKSIEVTGGVALEAVAEAGKEFQVRSGRKLLYFGRHHFDTESEHTLEDASVRKSLDAIELSPDERALLTAIVDEAFVHFSSFVDEIFQLTKGA